MKKLFLLLLAIGCCLFIDNLQVQAESFYEGAFIPNIWMIREKVGRKIWQSARFLRRSNDGMFAYCVEPFTIIDETNGYESTIQPDQISKETWERVSLIAYFGYGYADHSADKWYPITQIMIWKALDPTSDFYFTDSLNGNRIDIFQSEMQEIEDLIYQYYQKPSFNDNTIHLVLGSKTTLVDQNNILRYYHLENNDPNITLQENQLQITASTIGEKTIQLNRKEEMYAIPPIFYYHPSSQNLMTVGLIPQVTAQLHVNVINTHLIVHKVDQDTHTSEKRGNAHIDGAIYQIYNDKMEPIQQITIDQEGQATVENLDFGTYYIKEIAPGIGYELDDTLYTFTISEENTTVTLTLENKIIERKIEIYKKYGKPSSDAMKPEANISFEIYNEQDELILTLTTDENGYAEATLPFGRYKVKQKNTTPGYQKVDDFYIEIDDNQDEVLTYQLDNLEIPVPNTHEDKEISTSASFPILIGSIGVYNVEENKRRHLIINR